jgi:hypothetical protein
MFGFLDFRIRFNKVIDIAALMQVINIKAYPTLSLLFC